MKKTCGVCGVTKEVPLWHAPRWRVCSRECYAEWRSLKYSGPNNPAWDEDADRMVTCQHCGETRMSKYPPSVARRQKFCGKDCYDAFQRGDDPRGRRDAQHDSWARQVISRDGAECQWCGASGVELHAHHIRSYKDHPELRHDLENGITLCAPCHWTTYADRDDNGVNSGNPDCESNGNPEPSLHGNVKEGVTTRGRAYRRWDGPCSWCGAFLSKRLSDVKGNKNVSCSYSCAQKTRIHGPRYGSNAPTSALAVKARDSLSLRETARKEG